MTHLRQIMLEELRRRNYAESTIHAYIHTVEHFSRHFHRSPDQLGPEHIRQYQAALFTRWKLAPNTVTQRLAALRFFYVQVLKRGWSVAETPYPKKVLHLPQVLSQESAHRALRMCPCGSVGTSQSLQDIAVPWAVLVAVCSCLAAPLLQPDRICT